MRRVIGGMQISVDAKIEGADGYADWVPDWGDTFGLLPEIDACVLGARMYPGYEQYWSSIAADPDRPSDLTGKLPTPDEIEYARFAVRTPHHVLSSAPVPAIWPQTRVTSSLDDIRRLKTAAGAAIYVVGGAETVTRLIDAALVDEIRLTLHPLIAGEGKALFGMIARRHSLSLLSAETVGDGRVALRYGLAK